MSKTFPISPRRLINAGDNGNFLVFGGVDDSSRMAAWVLTFVNQGEKGGAPFVGSLIIQARSLAPEAQSNSSLGNSSLSGVAADDAPFYSVPFRSAYLNGAGQPSFQDVAADTAITDSSIITVPASGLVVCVYALVSSGSMIVYRQAAVGSGLPF